MADDTNAHLTPEAIAGYLAETVTESEQTEMEKHFSHCDTCRQELIDGSAISANSRPRRWLYAIIPAAAAAAIAGLLLLPPSNAPTLPGSGPILRGESTEGVPSFDVVEPGGSVPVDASQVIFRWHSAGDDPYYRITVTDEGGDVVWTETTVDTVLTLPSSVSLTAGQVHFWYVDALLSGAQSATTGIQEFVTER